MTEDFKLCLRSSGSTIERQAADILVLESAVTMLSDALNDLVEACGGLEPTAKAPDKKALMQARKLLPPRCRAALRKEKA